ncbi:uncharacterized protein LOC125185436 [Salvia hispanica]|uniref:uncharacterized protein LOC125185436 n=1 Tax=Salvia hispanica TaxID=49212 RepID=UPI002009DB9B|nr:uncharacterized protein LOC125185436 [Salvia hispanica]
MEDEIYDHVSHQHPLGLIPESARKGKYSHLCYGCWRVILPGEATYGCSLRCGFEWFLHKECMEMPREIMHPIHPSHPLTLADIHSNSKFKKCAVCKGTEVAGLGYRCSQACDGFWIHMECSEGFEDKDEKQPPLAHPSHPQHELRFTKKTRWCPFPCDACGATEKGDSYICTLCDYWIHQSCALLPPSADFPHHHHSLSLAFSTPRQYIMNKFDCGVCNTTLPLTRWVYHCRLCSYVVHVNCATSTFVDGENEDAKVIDDERVVTKFPIAVDDMYDEMIIPFVKRQRGQIFIPRNHGKYNFSNHRHPLTFTAFSSTSSCSSSSSQDHYKMDHEEYDEDDFDSILTCDGCTLAIREKKQTDDVECENENG